LSDQIRREPAPAEVGKALRLLSKRLRIVTQAIHVKTPMNSPELLNGNEDDNGLGHLLEGRSRDAANMLDEADSLDRIFRGLDHLDEHRAAAIRMRFGLGRCDPMTLKDVGEQLGLTGERVRQLQHESLQQLRNVA
jgi:RNA polymerase primary sigma factor